MRLSDVLCERNIWRNFTRKWRTQRFVKIQDYKIKELLMSANKQTDDAAVLFGLKSDKPPPDPPLKFCRPYVEPVTIIRQQQPAFIYSGQNLVFNLEQALALTNTVMMADSLPQQIARLEGQFEVNDLHARLESVVRDKLLLDATQRRLPRVVDITRLGLRQRRQYGIPNCKSYSALLYGLLELCERFSLTTCSDHVAPASTAADTSHVPRHVSRHVSLAPDMRSYCQHGDERLFIRRSPDLLLTSPHALPALSCAADVHATRQLRCVSLEPASPYVHLPVSHDYDCADTTPAAVLGGRNVHLVMLADTKHLRHLLSADTLAAKSLMTLYTAATVVAHQQNLTESDDASLASSSSSMLRRPVVVQSVTFDGQLMQLAALQLNTLRLPTNTADASGGESTDADGYVKNQLWLEPARPLFEQCDFVDGRMQVHGVDASLLTRMLAMYKFGQHSSHETVTAGGAAMVADLVAGGVPPPAAAEDTSKL